MNENSYAISPENLANFLLVECRERGDVITNLKLQKLLYYTQAWHLAIKGGPLFEEDFQAWVNGPVLPTQYQRFEKYKCSPILENVESAKIDNPFIVSHLMEIVDVFGVETDFILQMMTHLELPWQKARKDFPIDKHSDEIISKDSMRRFYSSLRRRGIIKNRQFYSS
jgi:uncharacterized phage-associated protein